MPSLQKAGRYGAIKILAKSGFPSFKFGLSSHLFKFEDSEQIKVTVAVKHKDDAALATARSSDAQQQHRRPPKGAMSRRLVPVVVMQARDVKS